jgi:hypothetical protein
MTGSLKTVERIFILTAVALSCRRLYWGAIRTFVATLSLEHAWQNSYNACREHTQLVVLLAAVAHARQGSLARIRPHLGVRAAHQEITQLILALSNPARVAEDDTNRR